MERAGDQATLKQYNCFICDAVFCRQDNLVRHVKRTHSKQARQLDDEMLDLKSEGVSEKEHNLWDGTEDIFNHVKREAGLEDKEVDSEVILYCQKCMKTFDSVHQLKYHKGKD